MGNGARPGPLAGVRVADFSWVLAGPHCTSWLAALGADVIRVETHRRLDQFRRAAPFAGGAYDPERAGAFHALNFGKRSVTLDLTRPEAQAHARELIAVSDVVVEYFSHGQMERFGLSNKAIRQIRPDVIMASSSGVGRTGPIREHVAYGATIHAYAGLSGLTGLPGCTPSGFNQTYTDPLTGVTQCFAILAALRYRDRTGDGCELDLSMAEATMALLPEALLDTIMNGRTAVAQGNLDIWHAPQGVYRCRDVGTAHDARGGPPEPAIGSQRASDDWIAISVHSEEAWHGLCRVIGRADWLADPRLTSESGRRRCRELLDEGISAWTAHHTPREAAELLQLAGVSAGPSYNVADLLADPHLLARNFWIAPDHPLTGRRALPGIPWRLTPDPGVDIRSAPLLGQHTAEVFSYLLGKEPMQVQQLIAEGVTP